MASVKIVLGVLLMLAERVLSARILLLPMAHVSHINLFAVPGEALHTAGHEVTILVPSGVRDIAANRKLHVLTFDDREYKEMNRILDDMSPGLLTGEVSFTTIVKDVLIKRFAIIVEQILTDKILMQQIQDIKFDLVIIDGFPGVRPMFVLPYMLGVPYIVLSAVNDPWAAGVSGSPSIEPMCILPYDNQMNILQRLSNTAIYLAMYYKGHIAYLTGQEAYVKNFAPNRPPMSIDDVYRNAEIFLINHEVHCLDYPKVSAPNYHYIGGSSAHAPKPLPKNLEEFVQGAEHGVIVMSFGSALGYRSIITYIQDKLLDAFERLPQRVVISADPTKVTNVPSNVKVVDWLPQNDMTGHPKTILFISHGGNNGQLEAIYHGVPMLTLPLTTEQTYNGRRVVVRGYGLMLNIQTFSADELYEAIINITSTPAYKQNTLKCAQIMSELSSAQENVVFWVNHVIKHGSSHLQPARGLPLHVLLGIDVLFLIFLILYLLFRLVCFILRLIIRGICFILCCCPQGTPKLKTKKQKIA